MKKKEKDKKEVSEHQQKREEVLRLYVNGRSLDGLGELTKNQEILVSEIAKYWLIKHGYRTVKLQGSEHFGIYAFLGIVLGLITMLVILYYLPI